MQERTYDLTQVLALANLTIKQAADLLNIHYNTFLKIAKHPGKMTLDQALLLAEAAGIGVHQIKIR